MKNRINKIVKTGALGLAVSLIAINAAWAQDSGSVRGVISDGGSKGFLPGAAVSLKGTPYRAVTGNDGKYSLSGVEPGTYTLTVSYVGFEDYEAEVTVAGDGVVHSFAMSSSYDAVDEIVVRGIRYGQSKELTAQKNAANIKNVISEEMIQSFPDLNTAEVLQRVSGIGIQRDNGEGRFITMRGTASAMTNVTINGEQVAFSNGENRTVELDVISASQLAGIEVTKVLTPDMDANAIGGSVNLKTRSAFDDNEMVLNGTVGGGKNSIADGENYRAAMNFADTFGADDNIGFSFGINFARTARERHNSEHEWDEVELDDGNDTVVPFALVDSTAQYSENTRDRLGINGQLEFRPSEDHRIFFSGMYNTRDDDQVRQDLRVRVDKGDYNSATDISEARIVKSLNHRIEKQKITSFSVGSEHNFGASKLDLRLATSSAYTKKPDGQLKPEWQLKDVDLLLSNLDTQTPDWQFTNFGDGEDYEMDAVDLKYENTDSKINTTQINFETPFVLGSDTGTFKIGGKYREIQKARADDRAKVKWKGDEDSDVFASVFEGASEMLDNGYNIGPRIDAAGFRDYFFDNLMDDGFEASARQDVNVGEPYNSKEKVTSFYAMTTQEYGKLLVLAGVRYEKTNLTATAVDLLAGEIENEIDDEKYDVIENVAGGGLNYQEVDIDRSYDHIFPNLQLRYRLDDSTNIRLAYSKGISPPDFWASMPYNHVSIEGEFEDDGGANDGKVEGKIARGNPDLDPAISDNFDFLAEHYFEGIGILSGGIFYKKIKNFNFNAEYDEAYTDPYGVLTDPSLYGVLPSEWEVEDFEVEQRLNGGGADLFGVEVTWQQQFTQLPGWLSGFGIFANYTYTNASNIDLGTDIDRTDIASLPEQMKTIYNLALTYEKSGLTSRLSMNHSGKYIVEVGSNADKDEWRDSTTTVDFSATYNFMNGVGVFFQANNLTNEVKYNYYGVPTRSVQHSITGRSFDVGLKYSF